MPERRQQQGPKAEKGSRVRAQRAAANTAPSKATPEERELLEAGDWTEQGDGTWRNQWPFGYHDPADHGRYTQVPEGVTRPAALAAALEANRPVLPEVTPEPAAGETKGT